LSIHSSAGGIIKRVKESVYTKTDRKKERQQK
jgi:hypothetical protein